MFDAPVPSMIFKVSRVYGVAFCSVSNIKHRMGSSYDFPGSMRQGILEGC
jgi:hypothetical protein